MNRYLRSALSLGRYLLQTPKRLLGAFWKSPTKPSPMQAEFTRIHRNNEWLSAESRSGPGSTVVRTAVVRQVLRKLVMEFGIRTLLDAPCGDFNWMKEAHLPLDKYIGVDVVEEIIAHNHWLYGNARREFLVRDLTADPLPRVDMVFCRDCLVHFSFADIRAALRNFRRSGSRYLLTTTFTAWMDNADIRTGGWRPLNLEKAPLDFPPPIKLVTDGCTHPDYTDKSLGLWRLED